MTKRVLVGIGASAGGFEALKALLKGLQKTGCFVYVIAQHMHSDSHSDLIARLLNVESDLPLEMGVDGAELQTDHVYLIPAGYDGHIENQTLRLSKPSSQIHIKPSVNVLLQSIAHEYQSQGVGVILSGVGSDGARGCLAIKSHGGLTIAQQPSEAAYGGMPTEAIKQGGVQYIVAAEKIGALLIDLMQEDQPIALQGNTPLQKVNKAQLKRLIQIVLGLTGVDFSDYREETLIRRLNSRLAHLHLDSIDTYIDYCTAHLDEALHLQQAFLVTTSHFFRDYAAFKILGETLTAILTQRVNHKLIRVFVPACASGEECYSHAILFTEIFALMGIAPDLEILGCDLNSNAIHKAREGIYTSAALKETPPLFIQRYFDKTQDYYRVKQSLRDRCKFIHADIFGLKPEPGFDLVSCRNLMIYLNTDLQHQLLKTFFDGLTPDGLLFIGQSENIGEADSRYYVPVSYEHKIYRRKSN